MDATKALGLGDLVLLRRMCADGTARRVRLGAHVSCADVGAECGASASAVSRWERAQRLPRDPLLAAGYARTLARLMEQTQ